MAIYLKHFEKEEDYQEYKNNEGKLQFHLAIIDDAKTICYGERQPVDEIWYTTTKGTVYTPRETDAFGANIISNTYENGKGILKFDGNVTRIHKSGGSTFAYSTLIKGLSFPKYIDNVVGCTCFYQSYSLDTIIVKDNPKYDSRSNCNAIIETATNKLVLGCKGTIIPNTVEEIGSGAFWNCPDNLVVPDSVKTIGTQAFRQSNIVTIHIGKGLNSIAGNQFYGCTKIEQIIVDDKNPKYDSRDNCNAVIETETNSLITGATCTVIPYTVVKISAGALYSIYAETINIPDSVIRIENGAFNYSKFTHVTIPRYCNYISNCFAECSLLREITMLSEVPPTMATTKLGTNAPIEHIYVPSESVYAYKTATGWTNYADIIEAIAE